MENLTGGTPPVRPLPCVVPCKLYFTMAQHMDNVEVYLQVLRYQGSNEPVVINAVRLIESA